MKHELDLTVRFCETDALGHINNTSYFIYLEDARIKFFEKLGYTMEAGKWHFIIASTKCDFVNQGFFNQRLTVTTNLSRIGTKSFQLEHEILDTRSGKLIAKGNAVIVYFDFDNQCSEKIPESLKLGLEEHLVMS